MTTATFQTKVLPRSGRAVLVNPKTGDAYTFMTKTQADRKAAEVRAAGVECHTHRPHDVRPFFVWMEADPFAPAPVAAPVAATYPKPRLALGYATAEERAEADRRSAAGVVAALPFEVWHPFCDAGQVIA